MEWDLGQRGRAGSTFNSPEWSTEFSGLLTEIVGYIRGMRRAQRRWRVFLLLCGSIRLCFHILLCIIFKLKKTIKENVISGLQCRTWIFKHRLWKSYERFWIRRWCGCETYSLQGRPALRGAWEMPGDTRQARHTEREVTAANHTAAHTQINKNWSSYKG